MTASRLFAEDSGPHVCYYCGGSCSGELLASEFVKDTFTNRDIVHFPGSAHVCRGCVDSMGQGPEQFEMIDGTTRIRDSARGMQPRMFSWVLTMTRKLAGTKAHIVQFRELLLDPPNPPFAIVLAESGQKQLIFRAPVAMSRDVFPIYLEDLEILVVRERLPELIRRAKRMCAATGKPALQDDMGIPQAIACENYYGELSAYEEWAEVQSEPMAKLASWVCPKREDCQNEHPGVERGNIPQKVSGVGRSEPEAPGSGAGGDQGRDGQFPLFSADAV